MTKTTVIDTTRTNTIRPRTMARLTAGAGALALMTMLPSLSLAQTAPPATPQKCAAPADPAQKGAPQPGADLSQKLDDCNSVLKAPATGDGDLVTPAPDTGNSRVIRPGDVPGNANPSNGSGSGNSGG